MKRLIALVILTAVFACQKKDGEAKASQNVGQTAVKPDTVAQTPALGADADAHGCKSSAGYTWSELKGECVRIFEVGTRLNPYNDPTGVQMSAFVIFDGDKAEIFVQTEKPFIAARKSEGDQFTYGDWQLIPWKGYVLKKNGTILYTGG